MSIKLIEVFSKQNNISHFQFIRYALAGGIAFITDFTILYLLTDIFNIYYLTSAGIAFIAGVFITYIFSIFWVFDTRKFVNKHVELGLFILLSFIGLLLTELIMWFFTDFVSIHYLFSKVISSALVLGWNFFSKKYFLFSIKH